MTGLAAEEAVALRRLLEPVAAHSACVRRLGGAAVTRLAELLEQQRHSLSAGPRFWALDAAFSRLLGQLGAGPLLRTALDSAIAHSPDPALDRATWLRHQQELLDALRAADADRARVLSDRNARLRSAGSGHADANSIGANSTK